MTLGPDKTVCLTELKNALRPIAGDNVDNPPAEASIAAIADAIYRILTADTSLTVAQSDNTAFWAWLQTVGTNSGAGAPPATSLTGKLT